MDASNVVLAAFSEDQTEQLTGISKSRLRYWDSTHFYSPSYVEKNRRLAYGRIYSFKDIVSLRVLYALRIQNNIPLQHLREVRDKLQDLNSNPDCWLGAKLYPFNRRVIWHEPGTALPQVITSGQYVIAVVLSDVVQATKQAVVKLPARDPAKHGSVEKSKYVMHNAAVVAGTRIPVAAIKRFADAGHSVSKILEEYPDLTEKDVQAALDYKGSSAAA